MHLFKNLCDVGGGRDGGRVVVSIDFIQRNYCYRNLRKYRTFMAFPEANVCSMIC